MTVYLHGSELDKEYAQAKFLADVFKSDPNLNVPGNDVHLVPSLQCYGEKVEDVDVLIFGKLNDYRPEVFCGAYVQEGEKWPMKRSVRITSFMTAVESKSFTHSALRLDANKVLLNVRGIGGDRVIDVTEQSKQQTHSIKNYLTRNNLVSPWVSNMILLPLIKKSELSEELSNEISFRGIRLLFGDIDLAGFWATLMSSKFHLPAQNGDVISFSACSPKFGYDFETRFDDYRRLFADRILITRDKPSDIKINTGFPEHREFTWSNSQAATFDECRRKYYFSTYGFWKGWMESAPERVKKADYLKKLTNSKMLIGKSVHDVIGRALKVQFEGRTIDEVQTIKELHRIMDRDFAQSESNMHADHRHACRLLEHEYGFGPTKEEFEETKAAAENALKDFFASPMFRNICGLSSSDILQIDVESGKPEYTYFIFDGVKVYVKPDLVYRKGGKTHLVDWKTGKLDGDYDYQLGLYALYLRHQLDIEPNDMDLHLVMLGSNKEIVKTVSTTALEQTLKKLSQEVGAAWALVQDIKDVQEERFEKTADESKCKWCNFRGICRPTISEGG